MDLPPTSSPSADTAIQIPPKEADAVDSNSTPIPISSLTPLPPSDVIAVLSPHATLTQLWSSLSLVDLPTRERAISRLSTLPSSALDEAALHLRSFHDLLAQVLGPGLTSSHAPGLIPNPPSALPIAPLTSSLCPASLSGQTQPQCGEAAHPSEDSVHWGSSVVLPWPQYRQLHSTSPPLSAFIAWWLSSLVRPPSDRSVNSCRLHSPLAVIGRLVSTPLCPDGAKSSSPYNCLWTFVGVFFGLGCVGLLHQYYTTRYDWPVLFASHGALASIVFVTPGNNAGQPYHTFMGTLVSTSYAVLIEQHMDLQELLWLAVALSSAASITTMQLLGCHHPPGGALSVLYLAVPTLQVLGWWYVLAAEVGALVMTLVALLVNNIPQIEARRYPRSWCG